MNYRNVYFNPVVVLVLSLLGAAFFSLGRVQI